MFKIIDKYYLLTASFSKQTIRMWIVSLGGYMFNLTNLKYFGDYMCYVYIIVIMISVKIVLIHQI